MSGLIDTDSTGLSFGRGLIWLADGLGGAGLTIVPVPALAMDTETGDEMVTELSFVMETE